MAADPAGPTGFAEIFDSFPVMGGLLVYAGGGLRASTAKTIKVTAGGASADADIIIPLSKMHAIHGEVLLKSTGQPPLFSVVELVYADTGEHARFSVQSNGRFDLWFVPEESYVLRAVAGPEAMPNVDFDDEEGAGIGFVGGVTFNASSSMKEAGAVEIPLLVKGEVEGITIRVPDPKPLEHAAPSEAPGQGETAAPPQ
jgi:opacity protein-like surface antigen